MLKGKKSIKYLIALTLSVVLALSVIPSLAFKSEAATAVIITDNSDWELKNDKNGRWVENKKTGEYLSNGWYMIDFGTELLYVDSKGEEFWYGYTSPEKAEHYKCNPVDLNANDITYGIDRTSGKIINKSTGEALGEGWYNYRRVHWWYFDASGYACLDNFKDGYPNGIYDDRYYGCYSWYLDANGWYYMNEYGDYLKNEIEMIDGVWYVFDENGYLGKTNTWYDLGYYNKNDNKWISEWWYVGDTAGVAYTGWGQVNGVWYYWDADSQGKRYMTTETWIDGWYTDSEGVAHKGDWYQDANGWYYMADNGVYVTSYLEVGGFRYYFDTNGYWNGKSEEM